MYILKSTDNGPVMLYRSMIAGLIAEISDDPKRAKQFATREDAAAEQAKYPNHLSKFEIVEVQS